MKKVCLHIDEAYYDFIQDTPYMKTLQEMLLSKGYDFQTANINEPKDCEIALYFNMPVKLPRNGSKNLVWIAEPPVIFKRNFKSSSYKYFDKVLTWNDDLTDGKKFIKLNYPQEFRKIDFDLSKKEKLICMVALNKNSYRKDELFTERQNTVLWFEKNAPKDFDLYGKFWDKGLKRRKIFFKYKLPAPVFYKGACKNKIETVKKYKFSIAYENWDNNCGYITEKIFDCFNASNVPVYLGAKNITKYIPENCFINKRDFKTYDELYNFLKNMSDEEYLNYLKNIDKFFKSEAAQKFSIENWAKTITEAMLCI